MPPFKFPVCPSCKKKNEVDLAKIKGSEVGYRDANQSPAKREYYISCQHCHQPFKITVEEEETDERKKR